MNFNEELVSDNRFAQLNSIQQTEVLTRHCADIESRIRAARSRAEAEKIAVDACARFEIDCASSVLRHALIHKIGEILAVRWGGKAREDVRL